MDSAFPIADWPNVAQYSIPKNTQIDVLQKNPRRRIFRECRVTRGNNDVMEMSIRDYCGDHFSVRVSLAKETVELVSPDLTWLEEAPTIGLRVAARIFEMLKARNSRSLNARIVTTRIVSKL